MTQRGRVFFAVAFFLTLASAVTAPRARADVIDDVVKTGKKVGDEIDKATKKAKKKAKKAKDDAKDAVEDAAGKVKKAVDDATKPVADEVIQQAKEGAQLDDFDGVGHCVKCDVPFNDRKPDGCSVPQELTDSTTSRGRKLFLPACNRHDRCYQAPGILQKNCDARFRKMMLKICGDLAKEEPLDPFNALCKETASTWYGFVRGLGSGHVIGGGYKDGQAWTKEKNCRLKKAKDCPKGWTDLDTGKTAD